MSGCSGRTEIFLSGPEVTFAGRRRGVWGGDLGAYIPPIFKMSLSSADSTFNCRPPSCSMVPVRLVCRRRECIVRKRCLLTLFFTWQNHIFTLKVQKRRFECESHRLYSSQRLVKACKLVITHLWAGDDFIILQTTKYQKRDDDDDDDYGDDEIIKTIHQWYTHYFPDIRVSLGYCIRGKIRVCLFH